MSEFYAADFVRVARESIRITRSQQARVSQSSPNDPASEARTEAVVRPYQSATSYEDKQQAADNIAAINDHISYYEDQMHYLGCYEMPTTVVRLLGLDRPELTQSTQYYAKGGTGAGADNSVSSSKARPSWCASI